MSGWVSAIGAGIGQMTPAQQVLYSGKPKKSGGMKRRRKAKAKRAKRAAAPRKRRSTRTVKLRKGSPAAKRRMAQLRKMRRRK
jgi:hypothetical protein